MEEHFSFLINCLLMENLLIHHGEEILIVLILLMKLYDNIIIIINFIIIVYRLFVKLSLLQLMMLIQQSKQLKYAIQSKIIVYIAYLILL